MALADMQALAERRHPKPRASPREARQQAASELFRCRRAAMRHVAKPGRVGYPSRSDVARDTCAAHAAAARADVIRLNSSRGPMSPDCKETVDATVTLACDGARRPPRNPTTPEQRGCMPSISRARRSRIMYRALYAGVIAGLATIVLVVTIVAIHVLARSGALRLGVVRHGQLDTS